MSVQNKNLETILYKHFPREYVVSLQHWPLDDFLDQLRQKHQLYFNPNAYTPFNELAWWKTNQKVYHHSLDNYWAFSQMDVTQKITLQSAFRGNFFVAFTTQSYAYQGNILVMEVTPEVFFEIGVVYLEDLPKEIEKDSVFIFNKDLSKWMIPSDVILRQLITNFSFAPDCTVLKTQPWQVHFIDLQISGMEKLTYDLFEGRFIYQSTQELEQALSNIQDYLYQYYRLSIEAQNAQPHWPEDLFEILRKLVNNPGYDDLKFDDFYGETHSLAYIVRRTVDMWQTMYEDAFSDSSDPDNIFSSDADECWQKMRKVKS